MEWTDTGILIGQSRLGEENHIVDIFTRHHGRYNGLWRKKPWPMGMTVHVTWRARLEDQLGNWTLEEQEPSLDLLSLYASPFALKAMGLMCLLITQLVPARQEMTTLYGAFETTLSGLLSPEWIHHYAAFEISLIDELGYGCMAPLFEDSPFSGLQALQPLFLENWPTLTKLHAQRQAFLGFLEDKKTSH